MLKKINLRSFGKFFLFLFIALPFLFQGNTQTFGQTATDCSTRGLLGSFADGQVFTNDNRQILAEVGTYLTDIAGQIAENKTSSLVTITVLDPLPAGLQLTKKDVEYGQDIQGTKQWTRYSITGRPTQASTTSIRLKAESPTCGSATGLVKLVISPIGLSCTLSATSPVGVGEPTILTWTLGGNVTSGSMTPAIQDITNFSANGSGKTGPLTQDTTFTLNISGDGQNNTCSVKVIVGKSSGTNLQFVKTLLNIPKVHNGGAQAISSAILASNKFVFGGDCGVAMNGRDSGGGVWISSEDGATVTERQACIDAGSGTNMIYQHANVHNDELHADAGGGFVRENSSWSSCIIAGTAGPGDCKQGGDGANRAVYYGISGRPVSTSPLSTHNTDLVALKNRVISLSGGGKQGFATLLSLPGWQVVTTLESINGPSVGFGDFLVNKGILYSISRDGAMKEVKKLVPSASAGDQLLSYSFDNSVSPARLAVWEKPKPGSVTGPKIYVYSLSGSGVRLNKTIVMPTSLSGKTFSNKNSFGVWGLHVITPGEKDGEVDLWKEGVKLETIKMQAGGYASQIVTSKAGYVAVTTPINNEGRTAAYLYKISNSTNTPSTTPPVSAAGVLKFVKTLFKIKSTYQYPQHIQDGIVANNKFILGGKGCLQGINGGPGGGVWIVSEDGSSVSERNTCIDGGMSPLKSGSSFHGITSSGDLYVNWGGDGFIKGNYSYIPEANHAVYYNKAGVPRTLSPLGLYNKELIVLKDRLLAENSRRDRTSLDLVSLPDWKNTGVVAVPSEYAYGGIYASVGFGDFLFHLWDGYLLSVSKDGTLKKIKQLVEPEFLRPNNYPLAYSFDNSTTPAKLAIFAKTRDSVTKKILVYKLASGGATLDKTINLPENFPEVNFKNGFGIWGDYVVAKNNSHTDHVLELWKSGQKIQTVKIEDPARPGDRISPAGLDTILISKNGYVAASFGYVGTGTPASATEEGTGEESTISYLFKIEAPTSTTPPVTPGNPMDVNCSNASGSLADLCKQYKEILRKTCLVAPSIAICQSQ